MPQFFKQQYEAHERTTRCHHRHRSPHARWAVSWKLFWQNLAAGKSGIGPVTRFDTTHFDCKIGGEVKDFNPEEFMPVKEARRTDRFVQYAVGAAKKAMADSGIRTSTRRT